jgi:hypothetical protein
MVTEDETEISAVTSKGVDQRRKTATVNAHQREAAAHNEGEQCDL